MSPVPFTCCCSPCVLLIHCSPSWGDAGGPLSLFSAGRQQPFTHEAILDKAFDNVTTSHSTPFCLRSNKPIALPSKPRPPTLPVSLHGHGDRHHPLFALRTTRASPTSLWHAHTTTMNSLKVPESGLLLDGSSEGDDDFPPQAFFLSLSDDVVQNLVQSARNGEDLHLALGNAPVR